MAPLGVFPLGSLHSTTSSFFIQYLSTGMLMSPKSALCIPQDNSCESDGLRLRAQSPLR